MNCENITIVGSFILYVVAHIREGEDKRGRKNPGKYKLHVSILEMKG